MDFLRKFLLNLINSVNGSDRIEAFFAFMMTRVFFMIRKNCFYCEPIEMLPVTMPEGVSRDIKYSRGAWKLRGSCVEAAGKRTGAV